MRVKDMNVREVLRKVDEIENKILEDDNLSFDHGKGLEMYGDMYDLMKSFLKKLHPGTQGLL